MPFHQHINQEIPKEKIPNSREPSPLPVHLFPIAYSSIAFPHFHIPFGP
jgi:hypothetical protein